MLTLPDALLISLSTRRTKRKLPAAQPAASASAARSHAALTKLTATIEEVCCCRVEQLNDKLFPQTHPNVYETQKFAKPCVIICCVHVSEQMTLRAPEVGISLPSTAPAAHQQPPTPSFWAAGHCHGLQLALDTRRPLGQRTSVAGRFRRSIGGGGSEEVQLLQACS